MGYDTGTPQTCNYRDTLPNSSKRHNMTKHWVWTVNRGNTNDPFLESPAILSGFWNWHRLAKSQQKARWQGSKITYNLSFFKINREFWNQRKASQFWRNSPSPLKRKHEIIWCHHIIIPSMKIYSSSKFATTCFWTWDRENRWLRSNVMFQFWEGTLPIKSSKIIITKQSLIVVYFHCEKSFEKPAICWPTSKSKS